MRTPSRYTDVMPTSAITGGWPGREGMLPRLAFPLMHSRVHILLVSVPAQSSVTLSILAATVQLVARNAQIEPDSTGVSMCYLLLGVIVIGLVSLSSMRAGNDEERSAKLSSYRPIWVAWAL